jgi:hypothetical protein
MIWSRREQVEPHRPILLASGVVVALLSAFTFPPDMTVAIPDVGEVSAACSSM